MRRKGQGNAITATTSATHFQRLINHAFLHVRARKMHYGLQTIILVHHARELEAPLLRASACAPCYAHRKRRKRREPQDTADQVLKSLQMSRWRVGNAHQLADRLDV